MFRSRKKIVSLLQEYCRSDHENDDDTKLLKRVKKLIRGGQSINDTDAMGMTPLHIAVCNSLLDIAEELIKAGADINIQDRFFEGTPLHHAVKIGSIEAVCMLLYYGADVGILHHYNMTPFMHALDMDKSEIAGVLLDYYDDFSYINSFGYNALLLAMEKGNPIALDLIEAGADVTYASPWVSSPLAYSILYETATIFKLIWSKMDSYIHIEDPEIPFLLLYLRKCRFATSEWLECLYLMLTSPFAFDFINEAICFIELNHPIKLTLFSNLILTFHKKNLSQADRLSIIHICLSLGAEAEFSDVVVAYKYYGFEDELNALIYVYNNKDYHSNCNFLLPMFFLIEEPDYNTSTVSILLEEQIYYSIDALAHNMMIEALKYFALPADAKKSLVQLCEKHPVDERDCDKISKEIERVPEIPSLLELGRNQVRRNIKRTYNVKKPYQFYDAIKSMRLPRLIKDIICFKRPVYN